MYRNSAGSALRTSSSQASDDQRLVSAASQSRLNLFAHHKILGIEYVCVDQFKRAPPVLFGLLPCRHLRDRSRNNFSWKDFVESSSLHDSRFIKKLLFGCLIRLSQE